MKRLDGKACIVTGGGKGVGKATCLRLAREGTHVAVTDIDEDDARAVCEAIVVEGDTAGFRHLDVTDEAEAREVFGAIADRFGRINVVVNNAGISGADKPTHEVTAEEWRKVMDVNGVFLCTKTAIPNLRKQGGASIVNLSSIYGIVGAPDIPPYHASKGAVREISKTDAMLYQLNEEAEQERYADWQARRDAGVKVRPYQPGNFSEEFNPNSPPQKQRLLYELLGLPVIERTKTKQPATGADVLEKLKAYTTDTRIRELIDAFLDFAAVDKIYGTFIPAMESALLGPDGCYYLFGDFNLGGTVSGRLSSSDPNLQTIPSSGTKYAKVIKDCFRAPEGWLMIGLDFDSLEDKISALTTKDPNKLKVYIDGFDGHCLRAYSYFSEQMPDIDPEDVSSINSIADKYKPQRQESKVPTFLLTYQGTFIGMMAQCGFDEIKAKAIEERYHVLYKASDEWVSDRLNEASRVGYVTCAFGLRVRTPLLAQVIRGNSKTPWEAQAEGRTAGNALGQSWCLLNSRASVEFMRKVRKSKFRLVIRPIAHIHDAQYYLIPDDLETLLYVNEHLVKACQWQDHLAIAHDLVKLGGSLTVFHPSWAYEIGIPNHANKNQGFDKVAKALDDMQLAA